jgi:hypothetical protein
MADMVPLFREMIQTLQDARASVENELELLSKAEVIDSSTLQRFAEVSASFYGQADELLDMMLQGDAELELLSRASDPVIYSEDTAERLERLAQASRS